MLRGATFDGVSRGGNYGCIAIMNSAKLFASHVAVIHNGICYGTGGSIVNSGYAQIDHLLVDGGDAEIWNTNEMSITDSTIRNLVPNRASGAAVNNFDLAPLKARLSMTRTTTENNNEMNGAFENFGEAHLRDVTIRNNAGSLNVYQQIPGGAGGIDNGGVLTATSIRVVGNTFDAGNGGPEAGGILNRVGASFALTDSSVVDNTNPGFGDPRSAANDCRGRITSFGTNTIGDPNHCELVAG